jgi:glycosyltransferase involved in cell wall biosynthesis
MTPQRIAVVKPAFGANGGFERHLSGLLEALESPARTFEMVEIPVERIDRGFGIAIDRPIRDRHDEYFLWLGLVEQVRRLDLSAFDAVITTQPPTYLVDHPRTVALFYHHPRQFYDQSDLFVASGFVDPELHAAAVAAVRSVEASAADSVGHWLAGSSEVARRLQTYWSIPDDAITLHHAPPTSVPTEPTPFTPGGPALGIGRFEWPKRQELLIAAGWLDTDGPGVEFVGGGSRLAFARRLDAALAADPSLAARLSDDELWRNTGPADRFVDVAPPSHPSRSPVRFLGEVDDDERDRAYARCAVVVAPADHEDYGLTVLEAMARARPVIVCADGGGLTEFVTHGHNGLIVDPTPRAIADAIAELRADPERAAAMGRAGFDVVAGITWARAVATIDDALDRVMRRA